MELRSNLLMQRGSAMTDAQRLARGLGWFSIGLGATEVVAGRALGRSLGMEDQAGLLRLFGLREIAAGVGILQHEKPTAPWLWARVGGDVLDLAALSAGLRSDNPKRGRVVAALGVIAAITVVDAAVASRL